MITLKNKKRVALVLSGGGIKAAAFHIGVCMALQEKGFKFAGGTRDRIEESSVALDPFAIKTYVGSSAGALVCAYLASGHSIEDIIASFSMGAGLLKRPLEKTKLRALNYFDIFAVNSPAVSTLLGGLFAKPKASYSGGIETMLKHRFKVSGLFTSKNIEAYLRKRVLPTNSFSELGVEFFAVATYLNHSRKAVFGPPVARGKTPETSYLTHATISDAVAASVSLPPFFAPYNIKNADGGDTFYFDGEIRDTLSTNVATDAGADLVISSYSIQPYHYTKEVGSLSQFGLPIIMNQALYQVVEQKILRSIQAREDTKNLINLVEDYFKQNDLPAEHAEALVAAMIKKTHFKRNVDYVYIHPQAQNHEMFFVDHFSLNPEILERIVKIGFKSALNVLRKYQFEA